MARRWVLLGVLLTMAASAAGTVAAVAWPERPPTPVGDGVELRVDRETLARVDLRRVHEELVPDWVAATGGVRALHFDRLRRAVMADESLHGLVVRIGELEAEPLANAPELAALIRAWNEVLAKGGEPWRLGGEVVVGEAGARYVVKSYRALTGEGTAQPVVKLEGAVFPVEIRRRVDPLGSRDAWLGKMHDHQDGIVILLDRVTSFALDELWPTLDPELPLPPVQRAHADAVRAELAASLSPDELRVLSETAADRWFLMAATAAIHERHACGSSFTVSKLAWNGFEVRDLATLQRHAELGGACPDVLPDEALTFATRSWHLRHVPGVREALEHLVAVVAEGVAVHEARHAADDLRLDGQRIACSGCPADTSHVGALEASAYLSTFADPRRSRIAWFQACRVADEAAADVGASLRFLTGRLAPDGCAGAPPADLPERAAALEREVFLRGDRAELAGFPAGLPVSSEYRGR